MTRLEFGRLKVYQKAVRLQVRCRQLTCGLPWTERELIDQLRRASLSVMLNIAEGAGEFSPKEKARFYRIAKRSATETSSALDALEANGLRSAAETEEAQALAAEIVPMLIRMIKNLESSRAPDTLTRSAARPQSGRPAAEQPPCEAVMPGPQGAPP